MSLYREVGRSRRAVAIAAAIAVVVGLLLGFALGRGTAPEATLAEQVDDVGEQVRPALNALELVEIEYPQAVDSRGEVTAETELQAAAAQAASAAATLDAVAGELEALDPEAYAEAVAATARVVELIGDEQIPLRVTRSAEIAAEKIRDAARLQPAG